MSIVSAPPMQAERAILSRRNFLVGAGAASAAVAFYAYDFGRHEIETTTPTFYISDLPAAFEGFRFVQISDIHLEEYTEDYFLRRVIRHVNAIEPDMVLVTGDFISRGPMPISVSYDAAGRCAELLANLHCPIRYGILGNHDAYIGSRIVIGHMEANGLPILVNRHVKIDRGGSHIYLAGLDDAAHGRPNLEEAVPENPDAPVILMAHEPDFADAVAARERGKSVDLILSGHTHGGQIRIPGLRPLALPPLGRLYPEGHFQVGHSQLYVNRGIGTVGVPFRLNCPPEITLATLRRAPQNHPAG